MLHHLKQLRFIVPKYGVKFMTKKDWRLIRGNTNWMAYLDDLSINQETYRYSSTLEMIQYVKETQEAEIYQKGIGQILYQMGKDNLYDSTIIKKIEKQLYKFKGEFAPRFAFGALYGFIALSVDNLYIQEFLDAEFKRTSQFRTPQEAIEIIEACGRNTTLSRDYTFDLIKTYCEPLILEAYPKTIKHQPKVQYALFKSMIAAQYFEPDLFDPLVSDITRGQRFNKLELLIEILHDLDKLHNGGDFPRSLQEQIQTLEERMKSKPKYTWRYCVEERRYWTMEELKARREDIPIQQIGYNLYHPKGINETYLAVREKGNQDAIEQEKKLRNEALLEDLLYDQYMLKKVEEQGQNDRRRGMKEDDDLDEEDKKDIETKGLMKQMEGIDYDALEPEEFPEGFFETQVDDEDDGLNDMEDKIEEASAKAGKQPQKKEFKKRKGRDVDDIFGIDEPQQKE